jgi:hypothetical protein
MTAGGELLTQFLLFVVVIETAVVLATFTASGFFSPRSQ